MASGSKGKRWTWRGNRFGSARNTFVLIGGLLTMVFFSWWFFCLPAKLFEKPRSTVLLDTDGQLLAAKIADDGQWRFPEADSVPDKFAKCILTYEDRDFYRHHGFSPKSALRAAWQNIKSGRVVSGASTITMQVMRMARSPRDRTIVQKSIETLWALRAEFRYSKAELLRIYASNAPFGGNVVGLNAAAWRYFKKPAYTLTWAESAALAILPNAPGLIYPGRNPRQLHQKRDALLAILHERGVIDEETYRLALLEELPSTPLALPDNSNHLLARCLVDKSGRQIHTTIDQVIQRRATSMLEGRLKTLRRNQIENGAILIADTETGDILAYVGNGKREAGTEAWANDMISTPRSSGSILKPFLFGALMQSGEITPRRLIPDIPTQYSGFAPMNYDNSFSGAVPAEEALARSLNIPAVRMLKRFGVPNFHQVMLRNGFTTLRHSPSHYGLSLILGGAEVTLWDLVNAYRMLGNTLNRYPSQPPFTSIHYTGKCDTLPSFSTEAGAAWATVEAMAKVTRPEEQASWEVFGGSQKIGWKTGTSYGFRDAWAVGITPRFTVGIWVGNATGEGRPGINGLNAAAPLLFDVFNSLPPSPWFRPPADQLSLAETCALSGMRASDHCETTTYTRIPNTCLKSGACSYCDWVHLDKTGKYRVSSDCYPVAKMKTRKRFGLPPLQAWYYAKAHPEYQNPLPWMRGCADTDPGNAMRMIYPRRSSTVFIPRELDGEKEKIVLKAAHLRSNALIYWHINKQFLGITSGFHEMQVDLPEGKYRLSLIDDHGNRFENTIRVETR